MDMGAWFEEVVADELIVFGFGVFMVAIAVEAWVAHRRRVHTYNLAEVRTSFGLMLVAAAVEWLPRQLAVFAMILLHDISPLRDVVERQWWAWLLLFLLDDFAFYWWHRLSHQVRILWAGHVNHHSANNLNLATAIRAGVGERLTRMSFWLWIPLLGFDAGMILIVMVISLFYQFWLHSPFFGRLPKVIEFFFNTPSHHRVHHARNPRYLDANHGGVLIIWDRLFGTFVSEAEDDPCRYGLTRPLGDVSLREAVLHEYTALWRDLQQAEDWQTRVRHLFCAPDWPHQGRRASTKRLRALPVASIAR